MRRRDILTGLAGSFFTACASAPYTRSSALEPTRILTPVPPVLVQRARILKTVVGLRPYRTGGFRLTEEAANGKRIIHNYGHGGDGVSLSWGCSHIAAELANRDGAGDIAVMGSGVMGLTTALILARDGRAVTIYAEDFPPNTTSNIAGALIIVPENTDARIARLAHEGWDRLVDVQGYGVKRVRHHFLGQKDSDPSAEGFLGRYIRGQNSSVMVDPGIYLNRLVQDARALGVKMYTQRFETKADVAALPEPTIVNCTGLGAGALFSDDAVTPERGQLTLLMPQPEIDYTYIAREPGLTSLYMFPRETSIVLGGTRDRGNWSLSVDPATIDQFLSGHGEMASWAGGASATA
ncbi:MAG: FAD-dependent oxidoreductase [Hyphomonadaceae bacterium]